MKIGIITFHWGTNYGGILQAYALQTFLSKKGYDVFIIDYKPNRYNKSFIGYFNPMRAIWFAALLKNVFKGKGTIASSFKHVFVDYLNDLIKENKLQLFREKNLNTTVHYESLNELKKNPPEFDFYVTGSDQVWNTFFTTQGEGQPTSTYFLDFGKARVKRIAYAVSFGCEEYPDEAKNIANVYMKNFSAISVRENSGASIVKDMGFENPIILPDPTLLLSASDYSNLIEGVSIRKENEAFSYFLRDNNKDIISLENYLKTKYNILNPANNLKPYSMEEWISGIKNASLVLTNSFHGVVFSIIFHRPFIVVLSNEDSSNMNDRFYTLLTNLKLKDRIINSFNQKSIDNLLEETIDWSFVDIEIKKMREQSDLFFNQHIDLI